MRELIRWYRESPLRLRVVFGAVAGEVSAAGSSVRRSSETILSPNRRRILVVCFGNICRSPVAARLLQECLDETKWEVVSGGTNASNGTSASRIMCVAAAEYGIDLSAHRARRVTVDDIRDAELVITMSQPQTDRLLKLEPGSKRRIRLLGAFNPQANTWGLPADPRKSAASEDEIPDPHGEDLAFHRECCERLETSVGQLARWIVRRDASRRMPPQRPPLSAPSLQAARLR
jgi:protein-tyrosine-phosphatase